ncbi:TetR/AcrR family transcriptional regulator [Hymenobacter psoromatis]|uniref:TetR/AcrR family transcriptional regulator n=1 Tax=Hymenobacter psoromatis TaxID=1484116 RepID=UPI001CBF64B7|nr:TetR/AcrR family transcriptional regulator [Hymenobacter psoromatis]
MARGKKFDETEIVERAIQLFTATGYHGTSAQDLVAALGISRSSLYDTFGDKQGLFLRALRQYNQRAFVPIIELLALADDLPATLRQLFDLVIQQNEHLGEKGGCLMVNSTTELATNDLAVGTLVRASMQAVEEAFFLAFRKAQQLGTIRSQHDARALARSFHVTLTGLRVMAQAGAGKLAFEDVLNIALSLL